MPTDDEIKKTEQAFTRLKAELISDQKSVMAIIKALNSLGKSLESSGVATTDLMEAMIEKSRIEGVDLPAMMAQGLDSMLADNETFVESLSYVDRQKYISELETMEKIASSQKEFDSSMLKAYIRKNKFELEMEKIKLEQTKASEEGFMQKWKVTQKQYQASINEWAQSTFGVKSDTSEKIAQFAGTLGLIGVGLTALNNVAKAAADKFEATQEALVAMGGAGVGLADTLDRTGKIQQSLIGTTAQYLITMEMQQEIMTNATKTGLAGIAVQRQGLSYANISAEGQAKAGQAAYQAAVRVRMLSETLFSGEDILPRYTKLLKNYHNVGLEEGINVIGLMGNKAAAMGVNTNFMLEVMDTLSESAFLSSQSIYETTSSLINFGISMKKVQKGISGPELQETYDALTQLAKGFDNFKYMAAVGTTDLISGYQQAVGKSDIGKMATYLQTLSGELGIEGGSAKDRATALAIAYEPLRSMGDEGIKLAQAIQSMKIGGSEADFEAAAKAIGLTERQIQAGKELTFMKDPLARLSDTLNKLSAFIMTTTLDLLPGMMRFFHVQMKPEMQAELDKMRDLSKSLMPGN